MPGETNINTLLNTMDPVLHEKAYVFCTVQGIYGDYAELSPLASFQEKEGLTLVVTEEAALQAKLHFDATFQAITLQVHSSLEAVGLTAAVSKQLALNGISANVVAAYYHDHIFVPQSRSQDAMNALEQLKKS